MRYRTEYMREVPEDPEDFEDYVKEIIDECEAAFSNIRDLLAIESLADLGGIKEAYESAEEISKYLY
jgi:hypothetical protein